MNTLIIETPDQQKYWRILQLRSALRLECAGMKHSSGKSVFSIVKQEFKFKGTKQSVLDQLCQHIENIKSSNYQTL
jgi:hypothetical protein